jgi:hypothetical protein
MHSSKPSNSRWCLGNEGGLEVAVAVAWDFDGEFAVVAAECFWAVTVAGVGSVYGWALGLVRGRAAVLFIAEVGGKLGIQNAVDEAFLELGKQAVGSEQVAGLAVILEKLVEECVGDKWFHFEV